MRGATMSRQSIAKRTGTAPETRLTSRRATTSMATIPAAAPTAWRGAEASAIESEAE